MIKIEQDMIFEKEYQTLYEKERQFEREKRKTMKINSPISASIDRKLEINKNYIAQIKTLIQ